MLIQGPIKLTDFLNDKLAVKMKGVYLWFYKEKLIYVGKAANIWERNRAHAILQVTGIYSILDSPGWKPKSQAREERRKSEAETFSSPEKLTKLIERGFVFRSEISVHWIQIKKEPDRKFIEATLIERHWSSLDNRRHEKIPESPTVTATQALEALEKLIKTSKLQTNDQDIEIQIDPRSLAESKYLDDSAEKE